jgi:predicted 2-oxoglutarate/Fe(II)-dependent dioxygenase YbiX
MKKKTATPTPDFRRPSFNPNRLDPCFCGSGSKFKSCCGSMAADRPPPHGVVIIPEFLDKATCRSWIEYLECQPRRTLGMLSSGDEKVGTIKRKVGKGRITDEVKLDELRETVNQIIGSAYRSAVAEVGIRAIEWFEIPQVLRYASGGWYGPHADSENFIPAHDVWVKNSDRDVSLLLYLNDDYEGGELSFGHFNYVYKPVAGDLLFFPSDNRYIHQADPVMAGLRFVVVSWAAFVDEPRVHSTPPLGSIIIGNGE